MSPQERFTVGKQPCNNFLRGDADIAALGPGNRQNLHQCPKCSGNRAWCDNCSTDHHDGGWETCKPHAYANTYDTRCYDLAEHFLSDVPRLSDFRSKDELAALIQTTVEDWINEHKALTES